MTKQPVPLNPWSFLPTRYFAEGLLYVLINTVSVILYKRMGIDTTRLILPTPLTPEHKIIANRR